MKNMWNWEGDILRTMLKQLLAVGEGAESARLATTAVEGPFIYMRQQPDVVIADIVYPDSRAGTVERIVASSIQSRSLRAMAVAADLCEAAIPLRF